MTAPSWSNLQLHIFEDIELVSDNNISITIPKKGEITFNMDMSIDTPANIAQELVEEKIINEEDKEKISENIESLINGNITGNPTKFNLVNSSESKIKLNKSYNIEKILFPKWLTAIVNHDKIKSITKYDNMKYNDQFYDFLFKLFN